MTPEEFVETERTRYPELFDHLVSLLPRLTTHQTARLGLAIGMVMPAWVDGGENAYLLSLSGIAREQVAMDPVTAQTMNHLAEEVEDHVLRNLSQKGRGE